MTIFQEGFIIELSDHTGDQDALDPNTIETTLPVLRPILGRTDEPLDKLATHSFWEHSNKKNTHTIGPKTDAVLGITALRGTPNPPQHLQLGVDSYNGELEITFSTQLLSIGRYSEDKKWAAPGQIKTRIRWQQGIGDQNSMINKGMQILNNLAMQGIRFEENDNPEVQLNPFLDYSPPHARLFNAAAYLLTGEREPAQPDPRRAVSLDVKRDKHNVIEYEVDQSDAAIFALRTLMNQGISAHAHAMAERKRTDNNQIAFFGELPIDKRAGLVQSILGVPFAELGKKNVYGTEAGNMRYTAWVRDNFIEDPRPPRTIFDLVHTDQRNNTDKFFQELNTEGTPNYQDHARYLKEYTTSLLADPDRVTNTFHQCCETRDINGLLDLRDALTLLLLNRLYPHLDVYTKCEYVDLLNPAMRRTIEAHFPSEVQGQQRTVNNRAKRIYRDIAGLQHNLLSVMTDSNPTEPIIKPNLDLDSPNLTVEDFTKGQLAYQAGDIRVADNLTASGAVKSIATINGVLQNMGYGN